MRNLFMIVLAVVLTGCLGMPENIQPVGEFNAQRYMGKWYEVARLDHSFERGLTKVTAEYAIKESGKISVINRGYLAEQDEWKQAEGKAYFVDSEQEGYLKVSFFGPFYGSYVVFELGEKYEYAFVSGPNNDYLWLLSRTPSVDNELKDKFINKSKVLGFDVNNVIWVEH
ncbi:lipocalin family protein [Vibrio hannami]|uniref:lipocalin family protein n=1 Tax=Vibrio hannami TaxID=2717094 RepID=UPI00240FC0C7|nr:lipocalin family protein [Vibrio hannami]MDG3085126.1 lipocalin family protein [Vibrio hannami]